MSTKTNLEIRRDDFFKHDPSRDSECKYQCPYCKVWQRKEDLEENGWFCQPCSEESSNPMW